MIIAGNQVKLMIIAGNQVKLMILAGNQVKLMILAGNQVKLLNLPTYTHCVMCMVRTDSKLPAHIKTVQMG